MAVFSSDYQANLKTFWQGNKLSDPKQSLVRRVEDVENSNWKQTSSLPLANEPSIVRQNVGMNPGMDTAAFRSYSL